MKFLLSVLLVAVVYSGNAQRIMPSIMAGEAVKSLFGKDQNVSLFESVKFNAGFQLVGINPSDTSDVYAHFYFIVDSVRVFKALKEDWVLHKQVEPAIDQHPFTLYLLHNKEIVRYWNIFPALQSVATDNGYYFFDTSLLTTISQKSYLYYRMQTDTFATQNAFITFKNNAKKNASFLFVVEPNFTYEGSFEMKVHKTPKLDATDDIEEKLAKLVKNIAPKDRCLLLRKSGADDQQSVTFIVEGTKTIYDHLTDATFEKQAWVANIFEAKSFWKQ